MTQRVRQVTTADLLNEPMVSFQMTRLSLYLILNARYSTSILSINQKIKINGTRRVSSHKMMEK